MIPARFSAAAVQAAIRENYAAYSSFDEARYRSTTTRDFLLLEHGELIDREGDVANMAQPGTGRPVKIGGYEEWTIGADGLIAASLGHYDAADRDRQVGGKP